jgi:hypothetical protein
MYDDYHLSEDDNHHSHRRGNLKSYIVMYVFRNAEGYPDFHPSSRWMSTRRASIGRSYKSLCSTGDYNSPILPKRRIDAMETIRMYLPNNSFSYRILQ